MAIYHLHAKIVQRSRGKNAVAAAAYRRAASLYDEKEQRTWDFTNKPDVIHSELTIPDNAPAWANALVTLHQTDPTQAVEQLWNQVEAVEKRKDSQLAREITFALPIELDKTQNITLVREFIHDQFALCGMIADWNVHWDEGNPHVHVMLTMRDILENGFGKRALAWNNKALLQNWREQWSEYANFHLHLHQHNVRIDHRSYEDQGIELIPTVHHGKAVTDMDRRGIPTAIMEETNSIRHENLTRIAAKPHVLLNKLTAQQDHFTSEQLGQELGRYINDQGKFSIQQNKNSATDLSQNPQALLDDISSQQMLSPETIAKIMASIEHHESVFTERAIAKAINNFTQNAEEFAKALIQIKASPDLLPLGPGDDGRDRFTTQRMFQLENEIQTLADIMRDHYHVKISERQAQTVLERYQTRIGKSLTSEQLGALEHILHPSSIRCLVGRAGTGKSFLLGAAKAIWEAQGLRTHGVALSGIAAAGLQKDADFKSRTIESFRYCLDKGTLELNVSDVIVMDEAGMTDSVSMLAVLKAIHTAGAKLVLVGDHAQLQPVGPGATFRALIERLGFFEIQTVYRQEAAWQKAATIDFSAGRIAEGLAAYQQRGCIHTTKTELDAMAQLVEDWGKTRLSSDKNLDRYLTIAHRNQDVAKLNTLLRAARIKQGEIAEGYTVKSKLGEIKLAQGDRLLFLKNDSRLGVSNGRFATIQSVNFMESGKASGFTVCLDGTDAPIYIDVNEYNDFTYGYAATVHKVQGMTVDHAFVYGGGSRWNRHLTYVALSRHRYTCQLYVDQATSHNQTLEHRFGRYGIKDSILDFPLAFAERRGIDTNYLLARLPQHLVARLSHFKENLTAKIERFIDPVRYAQKIQEKADTHFEATKTQQRREDARLVSTYVDANCAVGLAWQTLQTKLSTLGLDGMSYEAQAYSLIAGTQEHAALQTTLQARNVTAYQIIQDPTRYEKAIAIHQLDINKLKTQAEHHACFLRINTYIENHHAGKIVHRDRAAAHIAQNIKAHYPTLQNFKLNPRDIKQHALAHFKRQLLSTLTGEERIAFKVVEKYQSIMQKLGEGWSSQAKTADQILQRKTFNYLTQLSDERDYLAHQILKDRNRYDKALDFHQIGITHSHYSETVTEQHVKQAEARWYKLQQRAACYALRQRVDAYHQALFVGNASVRMQLAHEIVQDTKAHHGAIIALGMNTQEVWRSIYRDAKRYERYQHYYQLDLIDRLGFKTVESYIEAKRAHGNAWRELFESKQSANFDEKTLYAMATQHVAHYTETRNQLAAAILENISLHQNSLDYFKIDPIELQPQAYKHTCHINIKRYLTATDLLARAQCALTIIADPKSHASVVKENGINWRAIYQDARIAERKQSFAKFSDEEKALYRLTSRYREANQQAGRLYARFKTTTTNNKLKNTQNMEHAFAKRDYLAWKWVNAAHTISPTFLIDFAKENRLQPDKLMQQHAQHTDRVVAIERFESSYQTMLGSMRDIHYSLNTKNKITVESLQKANTAVEFILQLKKIYHFDKISSYDYALQVYGSSKNNFLQQINTLPEIKNHLQTIANFNQLDATQITNKSVVQQANQFLSQPTSYQRLDVKRIREDLNACAEEVAKHYLGDPKTRNGNTWRYGSHKGSLVVTVRGQKQGLWRDFQTNVGGDMLSLVQHAMDTTDFKEVLRETSRFLGGHSTYAQPIAALKNPVIKQTTPDTYTLEKIRKAEMIHRRTQPITGTLAERYLREHRGIQGKLDEKIFRYHPALKNWVTGDVFPALVIAIHDAKDNICGVQAVFLDPKTAKKAPLGHNAKLSRGLTGEGAIVHRGTSDTAAFAEDPETALSVAEAHPDWTVYVTFGVSNFDKVPLKANKKRRVFCADNDGSDSGTAKAVERAARKLSEKGIDVWMTEPQKPVDQQKWDFNDALMTQGVESVKEDLNKAILYKAGLTQESIAKQIGDILTSAEKPLSAHQTADNAPIKMTDEFPYIKLEDILSHYVSMELEQTKLVSVMHTARIKTPSEVAGFSTQAISHANAIKSFAVNAIQSPAFQAAAKDLHKTIQTTLAKRGGFIGISTRINKGEWLEEDIHILMSQLRMKAVDYSRSQTQNREQDGRSR
jgi:Ti-type conjugative transfer relaxase TraA